MQLTLTDPADPLHRLERRGWQLAGTPTAGGLYTLMRDGESWSGTLDDMALWDGEPLPEPTVGERARALIGPWGAMTLAEIRRRLGCRVTAAQLRAADLVEEEGRWTVYREEL